MTSEERLIMSIAGIPERRSSGESGVLDVLTASSSKRRPQWTFPLSVLMTVTLLLHRASVMRQGDVSGDTIPEAGWQSPA